MQNPKTPQTMRQDITWLNQQQQFSKKRNTIIRQPNTQAVNAQKIMNQEPMRSKTQHSDDFQKTNMNKAAKSEKQFSEEYLSLVNKLKINLSKQQFDKKRSKRIIMKEMSHFYKEKSSEKSETSNRMMNFISDASFSQPKQKKILIRYEFGVKNQKQNKKEDNYKLNLGSLRLSLQNRKSPKTLQKRMQFHERSSFLDIQSNRIDNNLALNEKTTENKKQNLCKKLSVIKQQRKVKLKPILTQHEDSSLVELNEININFQKVEELFFHVQILFDIYEILNLKEMTEGIVLNLSIALKRYVLGHKKVVEDQQRLILDDLTHIQQIYLDKQNQRRLRNLILLQRLLIIFSIDLIANVNFKNYRNEVKQILESILGLYLYLLYVLKEGKAKISLQSQYSLASINQKSMKNNIHLKKETETLYNFVYKKLTAIMKTNVIMMEQVKILIAEFQRRNVSINRAFYQLLKVYAIYLNNNQILIQRNYNLLKTFATCPSPYLTKPNRKKYTLVLDLDQTLMYGYNHHNKLQIFMRPFAREFLTLMGKEFQIVIFTSSLPHYSEDIISQLPSIDYKLYRYHTTRLKNRYLKDLNRLGRPLEKVIIVDNDEENFALQSANGIKISQWRGEDSTDQQLNVLGLFFTSLIESKVQDVREYLKNYKQFRKKYH